MWCFSCNGCPRNIRRKNGWLAMKEATGHVMSYHPDKVDDPVIDIFRVTHNGKVIQR